ncbi:IS3 family transposase [Micromonospora sp. NPDC048830]|uniref:IS3 family transposase n=1 Tax=Micromonospora sp. NPDC048830 TaxID=3364257 RepID=UPI00371C6548
MAQTRDGAENAIFAYIDGWYNTRRIQKELGDRSPDEHETAWHTRQHTQPSRISSPLRQLAAGNHRSIEAGGTQPDPSSVHTSQRSPRRSSANAA